MRTLFFLLLSVVCALFIARHIEIRTAITDFLPRDEQSAALDLARELSQAPQTRVVVFTLSAEDAEQHQRAAREFGKKLRESGRFEWVRAGLSESDQRVVYDLLYPARLGLLELPDGDGPVPDAWIDARIAALRERLSGPLGMVERRIAPGDPLGAFTSVLERQARSRGKLRLIGDQLVTEDGRHSVVFAATRASAFDGAAQRQVEQVVDQTLAQLKQAVPTLALAWSGVNRYAIAGEQQVRSDIERISTLSMVGIFLLYVLVFRSLREPLLVIAPIAFGCLLAAAVCQLVFGFVHGLALAFGSSIIGVAEDFPTHYFAHRLAAPASEDNEQLMRRLWPGMLLGGMTTIAGIALLFASGFPGLSQMALFGSCGVLGALLCTRYVLPAWSRRTPKPHRGWLGTLGDRLMARVSARPRLALWCLVPALLASVLGLPRLQFHDSVSGLRTPTPELEAENREVQRRLGRGAAGRLVVATGKDDEQALVRAEQVRTQLERARARGVDLGDVRSMVELVPSLATQRARRERLANDATFVPRLRAALTRHGFVPEAFAPFEEALREPGPLLDIQQLASSPLAPWVAPFRTQLTSGVAYLTTLGGAPDADVGALVRSLEGVQFVDQDALFSAAYARFRSRVMVLVAIGLVLVLGTLLVRYRSLRVAAFGMLPALFGAAAAFGMAALHGVAASLMHVIAGLLVLSMGVDYGIYALESRESAEEGVTTLGSVLLAALTTVLSFGLLGLSTNPALAAIGSTVGYGMIFTVVASPVVLAFTREAKT